MSTIPATQAALSFNKFQGNWPPTTTITMSEHASSIRLQFLEYEKQKREYPFYGVIFGTIMPYLCNIFSSGASLRLEGSPQAELMLRGTWSGEEKRTLLDGDYRIATEEDEEEVLTGKKLERERRDLTSTLDGPQWAKTSSKEGRKYLVKQLPVAKAPDSQRLVLSTSTASDSDDIDFQILRVTDGMFTVRSSTRKGQHTMMPAVSVEVKVPSTRRTVTHGTLIEGDDAVDEVTKAFPQVVQHAQFIFHRWPKLNMIWTMTTCGRYAVFNKFTRQKTPKINYLKIANGEYYEGDTSDIAVFTTDVNRMVDGHGRYSKWFKDIWVMIMDEVEVEYARMG